MISNVKKEVITPKLLASAECHVCGFKSVVTQQAGKKTLFQLFSDFAFQHDKCEEKFNDQN